MNSRTTRRFREAYAELPEQVRQHARRAYKLFRSDPSHPSLNLKKVHAEQPIYSVRIGRSYRALGRMDGADLIWFWIGAHGEYDKLL